MSRKGKTKTEILDALRAVPVHSDDIGREIVYVSDLRDALGWPVSVMSLLGLLCERRPPMVARATLGETGPAA